MGVHSSPPRHPVVPRRAHNASLTGSAKGNQLTESASYSKLERSGSLNTILHDPALGATRAVLEDDLRCAIESLEASTAAIQRQTQTLASQCEQLNEQHRFDNGLAQDRGRDIARLRKNHEAGRQNTTAAVILPWATIP